MSTYARLPVGLVRGEGVWLWDEHGTKYLDAISSIAVCSLGHAHPAVTAALSEQAATLIHTSNLYRIPLQERLADRLAELAHMDRVFFCNSGAEANEAALKIARLHGHQQGIPEPAVIVTEGAFHGRTLATLSATGNPKVHAGFEPLVPGFIRVPYNDIEAIESLVHTRSDVAAIFLEPVQGEGGVVIPDRGYLNKVRTLSRDAGWLMMLDEVQTGMCRTGQWFAYQHEDLTPDVMTVAKALGNGVPIGACLARGHAAELFQPGNHGTTFGGNPLACQVGLAVIEVMEQQKLAQAALTLGDLAKTGFQDALQGISAVTDIRNKGLMIGIELDRPCAELTQRAQEQGLLINVAGGNTIRLLPPLIIEEDALRQIISGVSALIKNFV